MSRALLDVNVLLALLDSDHVDHLRVHEWIEENAGWLFEFQLAAWTDDAHVEERRRVFADKRELILSHLRKLGLQPTPVGASPLVDATKALASETVLRVKKLFGR